MMVNVKVIGGDGNNAHLAISSAHDLHSRSPTSVWTGALSTASQ